jgi:protein TonB
VQGNWLLAEAAIDAARKWVYRPYIVGGQPVEVETTIQMKFELPPR